MHPRNAFVIQNNLIILPLKKKSTVYSTYMLTIIFERESSQKGKNTTEILVFGDLWGRGGKGSSL